MTHSGQEETKPRTMPHHRGQWHKRRTMNQNWGRIITQNWWQRHKTEDNDTLLWTKDTNWGQTQNRGQGHINGDNNTKLGPRTKPQENYTKLRRMRQKLRTMIETWEEQYKTERNCHRTGNNGIKMRTMTQNQESYTTTQFIQNVVNWYQTEYNETKLRKRTPRWGKENDLKLRATPPPWGQSHKSDDNDTKHEGMAQLMTTDENWGQGHECEHKDT